MIATKWSEKIEWQLDKAKEAIKNRDKRDLVYRASIIGENAISILRLAIDGQSESNLFMLVQAIKKYKGLGILSKDYYGTITKCYNYYKSDTYITSDKDDFTFEDIEALYNEIIILVDEVKCYLKREGKM